VVLWASDGGPARPDIRLMVPPFRHAVDQAAEIHGARRRNCAADIPRSAATNASNFRNVGRGALMAAMSLRLTRRFDISWLHVGAFS